jgi:hypothetical protein
MAGTGDARLKKSWLIDNYTVQYILVAGSFTRSY